MCGTTIDHVGEGAVTIITIQDVRTGEVIRHVEIGPVVVVVIPPGRGISLAGIRADARAIGDVGERAVPVVVKQIVALTAGALGVVEQIGLDVHVQPAVAIVVAECRTRGGIVYRKARRGRAFLECAVALVEVEEIGGVVTADVKIEKAVVVHIGERRALLPNSGGRAHVGHAALFGDVLELPIAEIVKEAAAFGFADDENVGFAIVVVISDRDAGADGPDFEFVVTLAPHFWIRVPVFGPDAGGLGSKRGEHRLAGAHGTRRQRLLGEIGGEENRMNEERSCENQWCSEILKQKAADAGNSESGGVEHEGCGIGRSGSR